MLTSFTYKPPAKILKLFATKQDSSIVKMFHYRALVAQNRIEFAKFWQDENTDEVFSSHPWFIKWKVGAKSLLKASLKQLRKKGKIYIDFPIHKFPSLLFFLLFSSPFPSLTFNFLHQKNAACRHPNLRV